jgi:ATP-dependent helicase/nuclease subunit A
MAKVIPFRKSADLDDELARAKIRHSLDESLLVEAAAGTGKTSELVNRIVAILRTGRTTVERVVAVTFTRKAAGELKLRLRQELDRAMNAARKSGSDTGTGNVEHATGEVLSGQAETHHLEAAIARLEEAHIGTIHSFCAEILRARPVEANVDPAFEELSELEAPRLYRQAFRRWMQKKLKDGSPGVRRCLSRVPSQAYQNDRTFVERLEDAGWKLIEWRDHPAAWSARPFERERAIDQLVAQVLALGELSGRCKRPSDNLFRDLAPARDLATWIERAETVSRRDYDALEGLLVKLHSDLKKNMRKGSGAFAESITREDVIADRQRLIESLALFKQDADGDLAVLLQEEMRDLIEGYNQMKRASGKLDFVDLLLNTRDLLTNNSEVRNYLQDQFTHIFVDEFQDTDPLQAEILVLLSADDPKQANWLRVRPRPGKLFLVGDPKQSIYRFRRADVVLYQELRNELTAKGVTLIRLSKSFRATRPIQECINAAFAPEMTGKADIGQPEYVALEEYSQANDDQPCVIALPAPRPYGGNDDISKTAVNRCLPHVIVAFVQWLIQKSDWKVRDVEDGERWVSIAPRHIAILFRRFASRGNDVTREYAQALEIRNIPHVLVGARSFHRREEVETVRAALTAVEWPDDELSVFATLKGSLFAIPDALLWRFKQILGSLHPFRPIPDGIESDFEPVTKALGLLADLHRRRNRCPIVETLNSLLEKTRAQAGFALRPAGDQVLANVYRISDLARNFEVSGGVSFRGFVEELTAQADRDEGAEVTVLEEGAEGVRLMTVHGAKGLEFPVVILADIGAHLGPSEPDLYVDAERRVCAMRLLGCAPWNLLDHQEEEAGRDRAEGVRVAYVAATRARDLLVVPAVDNQAGWEQVFQRWGEGWLAPLHKAIYPPKKTRRTSTPAARCPPFGPSCVILDDERWLELSIKPGVHKPQQGSHGVVWWDPATLQLTAEENFGLRQTAILAEDAGTAASSEGLQQYEEWKSSRAQTLEAGQHPQFDVVIATEAAESPTGLAEQVAVELLEKAAGRPQGTRFGTLVHTILRDVSLSVAPGVPVGDRKDLLALARVHGRTLGSTQEEVEAAIKAVGVALDHSLLRRAAAASRCHRELPVMVKTEAGVLLEGVIDLAFFEQGANGNIGIWTIVDFKTDAHLASRQPHYQRQLQWYVYALSKITAAPVQAWLLGI